MHLPTIINFTIKPSHKETNSSMYYPTNTLFLCFSLQEENSCFGLGTSGTEAFWHVKWKSDCGGVKRTNKLRNTLKSKYVQTRNHLIISKYSVTPSEPILENLSTFLFFIVPFFVLTSSQTLIKMILNQHHLLSSPTGAVIGSGVLVMFYEVYIFNHTPSNKCILDTLELIQSLVAAFVYFGTYFRLNYV